MLALGPWVPFLLAFAGRASAALSLLLVVEGQLLGLAPSSLKSAAIYLVLLFFGTSLAKQVVSFALTGPVPDMAVTVEAGTFRSESVVWAACSMRGWRDAMEDAHVTEMLDPAVFPDTALFAVLDGHGGKEVAAVASRILRSEVCACGREQLTKSGSEKPDLASSLEEALPRLDRRLRTCTWGLGCMLPGPLHPFSSCGSTACVAAVDLRAREVHVANVGDSRAILIRGGKALALSDDHKPENPKERQRIRHAGGQVIKVGPCHRVDGTLNLSRALGDFHLKANHALPQQQQKVIAYADSTRTAFQGGSQELLVVACDGLFERCSNQDIADIIWPRLKQGMSLEQIGRELLVACCARSCRGRPIEQGTDNETVILIKLPEADAPAAPAGGQRSSDGGPEEESGAGMAPEAGAQ